MNFIATQQRQAKPQIEGLRIETGGSVMLSPLAEPIPNDVQQPSNIKVVYFFGGAIVFLLIGTGIGWNIANHLAQAATQKAQLEASAAKFNLAQNQVHIDNFCKANASK